MLIQSYMWWVEIWILIPIVFSSNNLKFQEGHIYLSLWAHFSCYTKKKVIWFLDSGCSFILVFIGVKKKMSGDSFKCLVFPDRQERRDKSSQLRGWKQGSLCHTVRCITLTIDTPEPMLTSRYGKMSGWVVWKRNSESACLAYTKASWGMFLSTKLQPLMRQLISSSLSTLA